MRRATIITVRTMIVLLLVAAAVDVKLPGRSRDRVRIHLIDRSASVLVPGPAESLLPRDADDIVAPDIAAKSGGDSITWASFGRAPAFESRTVDPSATDLAAALTAALGRNPTEIVLYTDGRGDPGSALFQCRDRKIPVHVFRLGPTAVKDVRIVRIEAPAEAPAGAPVPIGVVVESTYDVALRVKAGTDTKEVSLSANVPARLAFTLAEPGEFRVDLDVQDACPENNHVVGEVFRRTAKRKILLLSKAPPALTDAFDVMADVRVHNLRPYDAVVLDNVTLPPEDQQALASWVKTGGGLLLLGGPNSYAEGEWKGTPIEEISPLKAKPDLRIAAVLGLDASGSMTEQFGAAAQVLLDTIREFDDDDDLKAMTFGGKEIQMINFTELRRVRPGGETAIKDAILKAQQHLQTRDAGRKVIILMTDGEYADKPEDLQRAIAGLKDIALIVITTRKEIPGAKNVSIANWDALQRGLHEVITGVQEVVRQNPGPVSFQEHPATAGVGSASPPRINRTTAKPSAQVVATVGRPPSQDPVLAFGRAGDGRVGALTTDAASTPAKLLRQAIDHVAGDGDAGLTLSVDPPFVRARGTFPEPTFETTMTKVAMKQVGSNAWEGRLPDGLSGTVVVAKGRARAAATIPCSPELEKLGIDRAALERIASETGGRVLESPADLATLPRPENPAPVRGRTIFLLAALALVFVEMAVSTFWKV